MEPLTIDCSGGFSSSFYGAPLDSSTMNPSTSTAADYPVVDAGEVEIFEDFHLGQGAYAKVVRGTYKGRHCAIKLKLEGDFSRVSEEARNLNTLRHEGVIQLFGALLGVRQGLVVELMEGGSLHHLLHGKEYLLYTTQNVVWWSLQCNRALEHIHKLGFVHRDVKPLNFVLDNMYQTLKLCDFGTTVTQKSSMTNDRGTAVWMAPEVFKGKKYDAKVDVFSFGIALWEMITRRFPFEEIGGADIFCVQWQKLQGKRPPMVEGCPKPFVDLMTFCWAEEPTDRPTSADIVRVLEVLTEVYPVYPPPFVINRSTKMPASARDSYHMEQNHLLNSMLGGSTASQEGGPRVLKKEDLIARNFSTPHQSCALSTDNYRSYQHSQPEFPRTSRWSEDQGLGASIRHHPSESERYTPLKFSESRSSIDAVSLTSSNDSGAMEKPKKEKGSKMKKIMKILKS